MTWLEFKRHVELQGLRDETNITMIDWKDYDNQPAVLSIIPGFAKIVQNNDEKSAEIQRLADIIQRHA